MFNFKANDPKKLSKIFNSPADCIVLDIEDGVALNRKEQARENISNLYDTDARIQNDQDGKYTVRINAPLSYLAKEDIKALFNKKPQNLMPKCLFVPKTI